MSHPLTKVVEWYLAVEPGLLSLTEKATTAQQLYAQGGKAAAEMVNGYMKNDFAFLESLWHQLFPNEGLGSLSRHIYYGMDQDYLDIQGNDIPELRKRARSHLRDALAANPAAPPTGLEELLHPLIAEHSLRHYRDGDHREAVLNAVTALFDSIRLRTGSQEDGERLINEVFSLDRPQLILSELESESGRSDQKGFMQIYKGVYQGVRNPKSHT